MGQIAKNVDRHVGERVRHRRAEMGMTQQDLAKALGLSYQQLQKYETAANRISAGKLFEIAQTLKVEPSYFFEGLDPGRKGEPLEHGGKNRATISLVQNFAEIENEEMRQSISALVRSLAEAKHKRKARAAKG
jgi:transcriptional regulator with XRE-family HTH domain